MIDLSSCRPLDDRILLLRLPDVGDDSAIVIPDSAKTLSHRGKVLRTGPGKWMKTGGWRRPVSVHIDEVVQFQSSDLDDGKYVLIQEGDILFIEPKDEIVRSQYVGSEEHFEQG